MKSARLSALLCAAGLAGCASAPLPPEAAAVALVPAPSKFVAIYQPRLVVKDGRLLLEGWVSRQYGARTTAQSHLDIVFLDPSGRVLRSAVTYFAPRDLRGGHWMQPRGHYSLPIPVLPAGTARIQVTAHEGEHQS